MLRYTGGKIVKSNFSLLGNAQSEIVSFCSDLHVQPKEPLPSKGTITGNCEGVQVEVKFENGGHGTATANVVYFG